MLVNWNTEDEDYSWQQDLFDSKYEITGYLNKGFRAAVYKAIDKSTVKHVSVKKLLKSENLTSHMRDLINREVTIQYMLPDHPNIYQSHGHFDTREAVYPCNPGLDRHRNMRHEHGL